MFQRLLKPTLMNEDPGDAGGGGNPPAEPPAAPPADPAPPEPTDWRAALPESVREWDEVKTADSPEKFYDQVANMRSALGRSIRIPGEDAGTDDRRAFLEKLKKHVPELVPTPKPDDPEAMETLYSALGRPAEATGYRQPDFDADEGVQVQQETLDTFKGVAHKYNLTQAQYEGIVSEMVGNDIVKANEAGAELRSGLNTLNGEWGMAAERNTNMAIRMAEQAGFPPELADGIRKNQVNAATIKALYTLAKGMSESSGVIGDRSETAPLMTPAEAKASADEMRRNKAHPYWNPQDPGHKAARERMSQLMKMAYPGGEKTVIGAVNRMG